jgi:hypothetical protein
MIPIESDNLISNNTYYIESHGPTGLIAKLRGVFSNDGNHLHRFDNVTQYKDGNQINIGWFHAPTVLSSDGNPNYYWKYFIPCDTHIKKKVKKMDTEILLNKMLLLRQAYSRRIGDPSTIMGMTHMRFGL